MRVSEILYNECLTVEDLADVESSTDAPYVGEDPPKIQAHHDVFELVIHIRLDGVRDE